jgi:septal ring factor EnvC (AmiA/AmiB activator)
LFRIIAAILILSFYTASVAVAAEEDVASAKLKEVKAELDKQKKNQLVSERKVRELNREMANIKSKIVTAARNVSAYEASLNTLEDEAKELEKSQSEIYKDLHAKMQKTVTLVAALENLASRPTFAAFAVPFSLKDTINSASLMTNTVPILSEQAELLQGEMARLSSLKMAIKAKRSQIRTAMAGLAEKQKELASLMEEKDKQQKKYTEMGIKAADKYKQLASQAKDLEDLLAKIEKQKALEAERKAKEQAEALAKEKEAKEREEKEREAREKAQKAKEVQAAIADNRNTEEYEKFSDAVFEKAKGMISSPVAGKVTESFGDLAANGMHNKGIKLKTRTGAQVLSPYDGVVLFAGYLKGYGKLLIIEHSKSYYSMLSGMESTEVEEGQPLLAGEPIGVMDKSGEPVLYMELRKKGVPINPVPWLALKS